MNSDLATAVLGGDILISINGEKLKLKVKPETQNGTKVRLRGKGQNRGDGTNADLIITYNVTLPVNLTERQKQLLVEKLNTKSKEVYESLNDASDGLRTNYSYTLYVPYQGQWQDYYCGPATVRQSILSYVVTNVPDQDQIATAL